MAQDNKYKILIADDSEMNRAILIEMLGEEYTFLEAENGQRAVELLEQYGTEISLVLLDIVMPVLDGFGVLQEMKKRRWIDDIPVIMISAESGSSHVERAYKLGVTDFVGRPFDPMIVHQRVVNTILLYAKQKKLIGLVASQIYEKEQSSTLMIDILSHIVEFRNGESGLHVLHVRMLTDLLLRHLMLKTDRYGLTRQDASLIATASALHDIGKIAIPDAIINKPGRLTETEFAVMKTHASIGAEMLANLPIHKNEPLVQAAYDICRWHHERYDGRGYPDGLKGDEIPISAQIVALADVFDALTSTRVYKPAFTHDQAVRMIQNGECGTFNPLLLECLSEISSDLLEELSDPASRMERAEIQNVTEEMLRHEELSASGRALQLLEHERMKYSFFAAMTQEIQFEYTVSPPLLTLNSWGADRLGLAESIPDPAHCEQSAPMLATEDCRHLTDALRATTPEHPVITYDTKVTFPDETRWCRIIARAMWSTDEPPRYTGVIGKAVDIHESRMQITSLREQASHDAMTGLLNHKYAKQKICQRLEERTDSHFALIIFDLDHFKSANDTYGHLFGDQVLIFVADTLRAGIRGGDIAARVGGDEFLIFVEHTAASLDQAIQRIYNCLSGKQYEHFPISISMGIATTEGVGRDYETLFHAADSALYTVKRGGRGHYRFYNGDDMEQILSTISPIDSDSDQSAGQTGDKEATK